MKGRIILTFIISLFISGLAKGQKLIADLSFRSIGLFGSVVRNDADSQSDVDIPVDFSTTTPPGTIAVIRCQNEFLEVPLCFVNCKCPIIMWLRVLLFHRKGDRVIDNLR